MTARKTVAVFAPDYAGVDEVRPARNFDSRAGSSEIDMLLLHYTGMRSEEGAIDWLTGSQSRVSCHYFVCERGRILQFLPETARGWHAGASVWAGESDINSRSIGIEIANPGHEHGYRDFPASQIEAVIALCQDCVARRHIPAARVLAHSDVAPLRKQDPGEKFPWQALFAAGVGHWVEPSSITGGRYLQVGDHGQPVEAFQSMLSLYGYGVEINGRYCEKTRAATVAFQRHFRPAKVDGIADFSTIDTLYRLLAALFPQQDG